MDLMQILRLQWDRAAAIVAALAGALVLIVGYVGVSNTGYSAEQMPYIISGGVGGIFLLGLAAVLWLSADLRDEWQVLDEIRDALVSPADEAESAAPPATRVEPAVNGSRTASAAVPAPAPAKKPRRKPTVTATK